LYYIILFKKEKELIKGFSLFNFPLLLKRAFKLFIKQLNYQKLKGCFLSLLASILVHWTHMQVLDAREINYCGKYQRLASGSILNAYKNN
jgi:hypothetical protein